MKNGLIQSVGKTYARTNNIASLVNNKSIAPRNRSMFFNGPCNRNLFATWFEKCLIKE